MSADVASLSESLDDDDGRTHSTRLHCASSPLVISTPRVCDYVYSSALEYWTFSCQLLCYFGCESQTANREKNADNYGA